MELNFDVLWIVLVIIGWIISAAQKANKKQQEQAKKAQQQNRQSPPVRVNGAQPAQVPFGKGQWNGGRTASPAKPAAAPARPAPAAPAQPKPLQTIQPTEASAFVSAHSAPMETHMHTPEMGQEGTGTEGLDCCHEYMLTSQEEAEPLDILSLAEADQQERAQALLQGVIFSEILGRRRVKRYGRRSA